MAIDGVSIIDSDSAYDIYNDIVERYKDGEDVEKIKQEWLAQESNFCIDELFAEIYWTAFAYSLWKIGHLDDTIKNKALSLISKGASELWNQIDPKAQKQRQRVLDKLATRLQSENAKPIKIPKPPKKKKEPFFQVGDVLAIEMPEGYGACFVSSVEQSPRKIEYHLACTRLLQDTFPTMNDFIMSKIACGKNNTEYALKTDCWMNHKNLEQLLPFIKKIGKVQLCPYKLWVLSPASKLKNIYEEITADTGIWGLPLMETYNIVADIVEDNSIPET